MNVGKDCEGFSTACISKIPFIFFEQRSATHKKQPATRGGRHLVSACSILSQSHFRLCGSSIFFPPVSLPIFHCIADAFPTLRWAMATSPEGIWICCSTSLPPHFGPSAKSTKAMPIAEIFIASVRNRVLAWLLHNSSQYATDATMIPSSKLFYTGEKQSRNAPGYLHTSLKYDLNHERLAKTFPAHTTSNQASSRTAAAPTTIKIDKLQYSRSPVTPSRRSTVNDSTANVLRAIKSMVLIMIDLLSISKSLVNHYVCRSWSSLRQSCCVRRGYLYLTWLPEMLCSVHLLAKQSLHLSPVWSSR